MTNVSSSLSKKVDLRFTLPALLRGMAFAAVCFWLPYAPMPVDRSGHPEMGPLICIGFAFGGAAIGTLVGKALPGAAAGIIALVLLLMIGIVFA